MEAEFDLVNGDYVVTGQTLFSHIRMPYLFPALVGRRVKFMPQDYSDLQK
jgi:hypothetical protein